MDPRQPALHRRAVRFEQVGIALNVLGHGDVMAMHHVEETQEDFMVLSGEALLIIEGQERPLKVWDFVHCPPWTDTSSSERVTPRASSSWSALAATVAAWDSVAREAADSESAALHE